MNRQSYQPNNSLLLHGNYELLSGQPPFEGEHPLAVMRQHLSGTVLPLTELNPALPSTLDRVIRKALQRQPGARYQTAEAFQHALLNYLEAGLAVQEEPQLNRLLGGHPQVRQRLLYALFLFAILGGIVLVGVLLQLARVAR